MHLIDLGEDLAIKVKYKGREIDLREPTLKEMESFNSLSKDAESDSVEFISTFLCQLGAPDDFAKTLGISKAKRLLEEIVELLTKKK